MDATFTRLGLMIMPLGFCAALIGCGNDVSGAGSGGIGGTGGVGGAGGTGGVSGSGGSSGADGSAGTGGPTVFLILMENHNWNDIKGNSSAPFINRLLTHPEASYTEHYSNPSGVH